MIITNFSAGELSDNLKGRIDLQQYYSGASRIENFEVIPTGGLERRVGTKRLAKLKGDCRLIPFIVNSTISIVLEIGPGYIYYWKNGVQQTSGGKPINIIAHTKQSIDPYQETDDLIVNYASLTEINQIQYAQNFNEIILTHPKHRPLELKYNIDGSSFTAGLMHLDYYVDVNLDDDYGKVLIVTTTNLPQTANKGDYCVYNGKLFKCTQSSGSGISATWEEQGNDPSNDTGLFRDPVAGETENINKGKYPSCVAFFQNRLYFAATENNPQRIWASATPDTKGTRYNKFATYKKYVTVNKVVKDADLHIFTADIYKSDIIEGENAYTILRNATQDFTKEGALKEDATSYYVNNPTYASGGMKVTEVTGNSVTVAGAMKVEWNGGETVKRGITFDLSLWRDPTTASSDDYEFQVTQSNYVNADLSFYLEPASDQNDAIKWLATNNILSIGTESNVWNIPSGVSAQNIQCIMTGRYGSDDVQATVVDQAVIFFSQGKRGIREYYYNAMNEAFSTNNIALLAEHLLIESGVYDFDFITNPYNKIVITRDDGKAATLLYDKTNGVMAWTRLSHAKGNLRSCAITRGEEQADLVYYVVKDGSDYYMEKIDVNQKVYLDSWQEYSSAVAAGYASDAVIYNATQHKGIKKSEPMPADFMKSTDKVYIGYEYESVVLSLPCMAGGPADKKRIVNLYARFNDSYLPVMKVDGMEDEYFTTVEEPYSGICRIDYPGVSDRDVTFKLAIKKPERCKILLVEAAIA